MAIETTESEIRAERRITTRFLVTDDAFSVQEYADEPPYLPALEVTTSHDKDRKMLVTSVNRVMTNGRIVRWKMGFREEDPAPNVNTYTGVRVQRFSQRALDERHGTIMANIADLIARDDELLKWASRASM